MKSVFDFGQRSSFHSHQAPDHSNHVSPYRSRRDLSKLSLGRQGRQAKVVLAACRFLSDVVEIIAGRGAADRAGKEVATHDWEAYGCPCFLGPGDALR